MDRKIEHLYHLDIVVSFTGNKVLQILDALVVISTFSMSSLCPREAWRKYHDPAHHKTPSKVRIATHWSFLHHESFFGNGAPFLSWYRLCNKRVIFFQPKLHRLRMCQKLNILFRPFEDADRYPPHKGFL